MLILILGTNKLPEAARKLGKASYEFNKAKKEIEGKITNNTPDHIIDIKNPVKNEREKLETIAKSLGITPTVEIQTSELKTMITKKLDDTINTQEETNNDAP